MGNPHLNKMPISQNTQVSCLYNKICKLFTCFTICVILWIGCKLFVEIIWQAKSSLLHLLLPFCLDVFQVAWKPFSEWNKRKLITCFTICAILWIGCNLFIEIIWQAKSSLMHLLLSFCLDVFEVAWKPVSEWNKRKLKKSLYGA